MNPDRWRQVADVYEEALQREPAARGAFLNEACRDDPDLRREVDSLLAQEHTSVIIDDGVLPVAAAVLEGVAPLTTGTLVGPYRIDVLLGAGGMGEVYRARDTRLDRDVALKILPESFTRDPDRLARFTREARVLASLNHPNIAAIHGIEDDGTVHALVLELVDGPTLAERIGEGPIELADALAIARQIADALGAAHEHGIVHRDLKPSNIKVRADGTVKVLDFGMAKIDATSDIPGAADPAVTAMGVLLGTAAYMSPEQARGLPADRRSDIWAFGCVLYEMLTARRAFAGDHLADTLALVLKAQPDWAALPAAAPPQVRRLLRRALEKDAKRRLSDMADARLEIDDAQEQVEDRAPDSTAPDAIRRAPAVPWAFAAVLAVALISAIIMWRPWRVASSPAAQHLSTELGAAGFLARSVEGTPQLALSPDGSMLAFVAERDHADRLYLRRFGQLDAVPLAAGPVSGPFFSPDSKWVGFFSSADSKLKKVPVAGGSAVTICDVESMPRGASWGDDDAIVFNPFAGSWSALLRVRSTGGKPEPVSILNEGEVSHRWPQVLPGARAVLYAAFGTQGGIDAANIVAQPLPAGLPHVVLRGAHYARYVRSGHLVYAQGATLFAVPFDVGRLEVTGSPVAVVQGVMAFKMSGASLFDVSDSGTLAYVSGQLIGTEAPMAWMRRDGVMTAMPAAPRDWRAPQVSPDGKRIAFHVDDGRQLDVYTYEWARDFSTQLTSDPAVDSYPIWSPDGGFVVFSSSRGATQLANLYWVSADGSGAAHRLTESNERQLASAWHPSGRYLVYEQQIPRQHWELMVLPVDVGASGLTAAGTPTRLLSKSPQRRSIAFSTDGRWLAYTSNESGHPEIYVRPFPGPGAARQVSAAGGSVPTWSRRRSELFYVSPDSHLMVVSYTVEGTTFRAGPAQKWSERPINERPGPRPFDLHPDGDRVVVAGTPRTTADVDKVVLVSNFLGEIRRRFTEPAR